MWLARRADSVLYLRSLSDSARLRDRLKSAGKVVVIGSGFIGMEVASQSAQQGCETTMVFPEERVWKSFFTPEISRFFQKYYEDQAILSQAFVSADSLQITCRSSTNRVMGGLPTIHPEQACFASTPAIRQ